MIPLDSTRSMSPQWEIRQGDALDRLREMPDESVQCSITSPPYYGLRDYDVEGQIGLEPTLDEYIVRLVGVFSELRRVLRSDGTLWLNIGDTYSGGRNGKPGLTTDVKHRGRTRGWLPPQAAGGSGLAFKQLCGVPWRLALALQADGWWLREDVIWDKPNAMPEPVADRCTRAHEYLFRLTKSARYYSDMKTVAEPAVSNHPSGNGYARPESLSKRNADGTARGQAQGWNDIGGTRNKRSVWSIPVRPFADAHFAVYPEALVVPCVRISSQPGDLVLDPFSGSGTTGVVAILHGRKYVGVELSPDYAEMSRQRLAGVTGPLPGLEAVA